MFELKQFLENPEMRFVLVYPNDKKPIGLKWGEKNSPNNYSYSEILNELNKPFNEDKLYGVCCGAGNILVIDADKKENETLFFELDKILQENFPQTLTVETTSGGKHYYFKLKNPEIAKSHNLEKNDIHIGEIRWLSKKNTYSQVIAPFSKLNGVEYKIIKDLPISEIFFEEITLKLHNYILDVIKEQKKTSEENKTLEIDLTISDVISLSKLERNGNQYQGCHPKHGSTTGKNFCVDTSQNVWYCFRHEIGGSPIQLLAIMEGIIDCCDAKDLKGKKFKETIKIAEKKLGRKIIKEPLSNIGEKIKKGLDYRGLAIEIVSQCGIIYDKNKIWWAWDEKTKSWAIIDDIDILNMVDESTNNEIYTLNSEIKNTILEGLKREGRKNHPIELKKTQIQFMDKIIDVVSGEIVDSSKKYFTTNPIPWAIGETEETPIIDKLFSDWVGEDKKSWLYEMMAYLVVQDYFIHRIFCFTGSGSNGKSKFIELMERFVGYKNATSTDLDFLTKRQFETAKLFKKLLCTMGETDFAVLSQTNLLKKITGQDLVGFEFKGKDPFDDKNYAKIVIATNSLPATDDKTDGFYRRWAIIDFPNTFEENGLLLQQITETEYSNLCKKIIPILKRLFETNKFSFDKNIQQKRIDYEEHSNPLNKFIAETYIKNPLGEIPFFEFYDRFETYLAQKKQRLISKKVVSSLLELMGYETQRKNVKKEDGEYTTWHFIIGLSPKYEIIGERQNNQNNQVRNDGLWQKND